MITKPLDMSFIKPSIISFFMLLFMASFSNCSSSKNANNQASKIAQQDLQEKPSFTLGETSFKYWVAGIQGGGSGITLSIAIENNKNDVVLDTVYFRGMEASLERVNNQYVANFNTDSNKKSDLIMSTEKNAEYGNALPDKADFPFSLKDNECVVRYKEDTITKYYKIENLIEKPRDQYPSAPPKH